MPATYTHTAYGESVLAVLDDSLKRKIEKYRSLYDIGLSGPDILFFYRPFGHNQIQEIGYKMHQQPARDFFTKARKLIQTSTNPEAALVYILGFINHFTLDSECHPLVNKTVRENEVSHSELESEFDAVFMREKGLDPVRTRVCDHVKCNKEAAEIIAPFFQVEPKAILESLWTMKLILNTCVAPGEMKRKLIYGLMKKVGAYESYQGLVFNRVPREDTIEVCQVLRKQFDQAIEASVHLINEYIKTLATSEVLDERYDRNYE